MKSIKELTLGQAMRYCRKKTIEYSSRDKIAKATGIDKWKIGSIERDESLPTKEEWMLLSPLLQNQELAEKGFELIEYKRTHPNVVLCLADDTICWKCGKKMRSAYGLLDGYPLSPDDFNDEMLKLSREWGVILQERKSNTTGETHIVNVCPCCNAFIGEFYIHDLLYGEKERIVVKDVSDFIE